ncbi:MAG: hypothetical protein JSW35_08075, partial [Deltaproteobacteria bacterium]
VLPGIRLPDTIVLMTHGSTAIAIFFIVVFEYLGPGITLFSIDLLYVGSHFPIAFYSNIGNLALWTSSETNGSAVNLTR